MYEELGQLIKYIGHYYELFNRAWESDSRYVKVNLKKNTIKDIQCNSAIYKIIVSYRNFLSSSTFDFEPDMEMPDSISIINSRTKAYNSMIYKIQKNINNSLCGNVPINKILNDLFGIRIILSEDFTYEQIKKYIDYNFPNLKCIDSSKNGYNGTHIYFKKDNYSFEWELQVWSEQWAQANIALHKLYKQDYLAWEKQSKGGV